MENEKLDQEEFYNYEKEWNEKLKQFIDNEFEKVSDEKFPGALFGLTCALLDGLTYYLATMEDNDAEQFIDVIKNNIDEMVSEDKLRFIHFMDENSAKKTLQ